METSRGNLGDVRLDRNDGIPARHGFVVQAKKGKRPNPWAALREAVDAAESEGVTDLLPVAMIHKDQEKPGQGSEKMVCMPPEVFAHLAANMSHESW